MERDRDTALDALRELALRTLDPAFAPRVPEDEPRLFPGGLPPDLPVPIPLPEGSRLVGSYVDHQKTVTVFLDVPLPREAVFAFYDQQLTGMDWTRIEQHPRLGGFAGSATRPAEPYEGGVYCRSAHGPAITIQGVATADRQTALRLILHTDPLQTPCAGPGDPAGSEPVLPVLSAPPDTTLLPRFRAGSGTFRSVLRPVRLVQRAQS